MSVRTQSSTVIQLFGTTDAHSAGVEQFNRLTTPRGNYDEESTGDVNTRCMGRWVLLGQSDPVIAGQRHYGHCSANTAHLTHRRHLGDQATLVHAQRANRT